MLAKDVVAAYEGRARFVNEDFGNSRLAKRYGIKRYPVIFVDDALLARPEDFGGWGKATGKYHPWREQASHTRFKQDLKRMIDLALRGRAPIAKRTTEGVAEIAAMPALTATDLNGKAVEPAALAGRVTIVEFWATWCGPCRSTLGWLGELKQRYGEQVEVLTVAVESEEAEVQQQLAALKHPLRVVMGTEALAASFGGISSVPTMFVFDRQGKTAQVFYGAPTDLHQKAETLLRSLLKQSGVTQHNQSGQSDARASLETADEALGKAWTSKNLDAFMNFYAEDAVAMWADEPVRKGREAIREMYRVRWSDPHHKITTGQRTVFEVSSSGDLAYMQGESTFQWTKRGQRTQSRGSWVTIWRRSGGHWRIVSEVWNRIEDQPTSN